MIEQIYTYFSINIIYMWLNIGVLPFWLILIFFPQTRICKIFVTSIFPIIILTAINIYLIFIIYKSGFNLLNSFNIYLGFDQILVLFSEENFLILFWIHFLAINLFCGGWIVNDSEKFLITKFLIFFPLLLTYFIGPLGLLMYWFIRIFYAKRINLYD